MTRRTKMAAANWKMNLTVDAGRRLVTDIIQGLPTPMACEVVIAPPFTHLSMLRDLLRNSAVQVGAQRCHPADSGAYTGEVSLGMLADFSVSHVIAGHSERRMLFGETGEFIRQQVDAILQADMTPIFCCGESLPVRETGGEEAFVLEQLESSLFHLSTSDIGRVIIAYEPIWAIGTGVTASPAQAQAMHAFLRSSIQARYGQQTADAIRILYGGSIKADNAETLFGQPDVDGGLVGGASLEAASFLSIIRAACG